ncbi:hypothetical protein Scep_018520 [Stephania cephalantha]|uniref:Glycosyltransferase n=1 Tax=Stephania cephalantha TaxID=152367 RepID=A0AAP0IA07_9MAGN
MAAKLHAVCIPFPAQGHLHPMMDLAQLLHFNGFHITYVNTEFNHNRLLRSKGPEALKGLPDFRFETISDGLPPSDRDATQDVAQLCASTRKNCLKFLLELLDKLSSSPGVPPISHIVSDGVMSFGIKAAEALGVKNVLLWTASACGFMGYLQYKELLERGLVPLKDDSYLTNGYLDTKLDWVPGMPGIRFRDLPSFARTTDPNEVLFDFVKEETQNCLKGQAIIINTFDELEHEVLDAIESMLFPRIYAVGPLFKLYRNLPAKAEAKSLRVNLWKEESDCLKWLEMRQPRSVVYVSFGCVTVMSDQHLIEFAWGLANSKHPFLWMIRPDIVMGESAAAILPEEFVEETKDRGMIANWCPQEQVLSHPSVGGFLTHCGWNSTLEGINGGVPMICWPFFAEQQTNCRYIDVNWEMGMEIGGDVRREEIEITVKELMEGERGKKMRDKALDWKDEADKATQPGGSSYNNFDRLLKEVFLTQD